MWDRVYTTEIPNNLRPVAYASKTLTSCESNYSYIKRELLEVLFSVLHFKHFTYGHKDHIITDHKPLVSVFRKSLTSASPRLSRMLLCILDYQLDVMYQPGTKMHLSDALSRLTSYNNVIWVIKSFFNILPTFILWQENVYICVHNLRRKMHFTNRI